MVNMMKSIGVDQSDVEVQMKEVYKLEKRLAKVKSIVIEFSLILKILNSRLSAFYAVISCQQIKKRKKWIIGSGSLLILPESVH